VTTALTLCRRGGTVVLEGIGAASPSISPDQISLGQLRVQGSFGSSSAAWDWVVGLFTQGLLDPSPLITHGYSLQEHGVAFSTAQRGDALKVQLLPHGEMS
jgi:threonine dehydrogenase-like Zn-dependent dehydrogenase